MDLGSSLLATSLVSIAGKQIMLKLQFVKDINCCCGCYAVMDCEQILPQKRDSNSDDSKSEKNDVLDSEEIYTNYKMEIKQAIVADLTS